MRLPQILLVFLMGVSVEKMFSLPQQWVTITVVAAIFIMAFDQYAGVKASA